MKITALLLLTLNTWTSIFCCCMAGNCGSEMDASCGSEHNMAMMPEMAIDHETNQGHCEDRQTSSQQQTESQDEGPAVTMPCDCEKYASTFGMFLLPKAENQVLTAPLVLFTTTWLTAKQLQAQTKAEPVAGVFLVSARSAPSLSVLARFLI